MQQTKWRISWMHFVFFFAVRIEAGYKIGDTCMQADGAFGTCRQRYNCPSFKEKTRRGESVASCGIINSEIIVCCDFTRRQPATNTKKILSKSISQQKCEEYSYEGARLAGNSDCVSQASGFIVGGERVSPGELPYVVALGGYDSRIADLAWLCGGTLISEDSVLTAAHCLYIRTAELTLAKLGAIHLLTDDDSILEIPIKDKLAHPDYNRRNNRNDIGIIRLRSRVRFTENVKPACLGQVGQVSSYSKAIAAGWGATAFRGDLSNELLKVVLDIDQDKSCRKHYTKPNVKESIITDSQICAGGGSSNKDTCQGDSGGPLVVIDSSNRCKIYLLGITSFGRGCGTRIPAVYTNVASFVPWIETIVWGH